LDCFFESKKMVSEKRKLKKMKKKMEKRPQFT